MKAYEYLAKMFSEYGVTHLFYQEAMLLKTLLESEKHGIKPILVHNELAAGYMADGYARITNRPGLCFAQAIGAPNLAASLHDAWLGTTPVIALTGKKPPEFQFRNAYQESLNLPMFGPMTKFNAEVNEAAVLPHVIRQCYREAVTGKPRPVHAAINGHYSLETEMQEIDEPFCVEPAFSKYPANRPSAEPSAVEAAARRIAESQKPLLVVGRGAIVSDAHDALKKLAEKLDVPVVTTPDGKTILDETHPLWAGIVGGYGMDCANRAAQICDLVIFVGTQTSDQTTCNWAAPGKLTKCIQIDIDGAELGRSYPDTLGLLGDARTVLHQLIATVAKRKNPAWRGEVDALVADTVSRHKALWALNASPIRTERLCSEISKALPDDAILVSDTGWSAVWSATMIRMKVSQRYIRAAGTLGWAFPAALGVKCGAPDRPVVCFTGDGGFFGFSNEMETAARCGINTVTVINNNGVLGQVIPGLKAIHSGDPQEIVDMCAFQPINLAKVAEDFGLLGIRVENPADLGPAIQNALAAGRPAVVEVVTDTYQDGPLPAIK